MLAELGQCLLSYISGDFPNRAPLDGEVYAGSHLAEFGRISDLVVGSVALGSGQQSECQVPSMVGVG